jgi:hypothetical protein
VLAPQFALRNSDDVTGRRVHPKATQACPEASPGLRHEYARGRGSHRIFYLGARRTTVKDLKEEIGKGLIRQMCSDLGIDPADLT